MTKPKTPETNRTTHHCPLALRHAMPRHPISSSLLTVVVETKPASSSASKSKPPHKRHILPCINVTTPSTATTQIILGPVTPMATPTVEEQEEPPHVSSISSASSSHSYASPAQSPGGYERLTTKGILARGNTHSYRNNYSISGYLHGSSSTNANASASSYSSYSASMTSSSLASASSAQSTTSSIARATFESRARAKTDSLKYARNRNLFAKCRISRCACVFLGRILHGRETSYFRSYPGFSFSLACLTLIYS